MPYCCQGIFGWSFASTTNPVPMPFDFLLANSDRYWEKFSISMVHELRRGTFDVIELFGNVLFLMGPDVHKSKSPLIVSHFQTIASVRIMHCCRCKYRLNVICLKYRAGGFKHDKKPDPSIYQSVGDRLLMPA